MVPGAPSSTAPTQVWEDGEGESGVQRENLAPSGILEKLIPQDTQPWLCYTRDSSSDTRTGRQGTERKLPEAILEGGFLKEAAP